MTIEERNRDQDQVTVFDASASFSGIFCKCFFLSFVIFDFRGSFV